ncbi:RNA-directed DNA polymerase [Marinicauda sp. Alg238-R41]|uniref:RNA-directed DNA polymerase n=1 Tax=Marinicauda sp. Alg238-R41 TaxID=2993447 RepID=UPI0022E1961C|nr:RNA-directed DNA polymerase [Marinicauda sp. Alg238-R41]
MFKLSQIELEKGKAAVESHGIAGFLPEPPEWQIIKDEWPDVCSHIMDIDLDVYNPYEVPTTYVRKNDRFIRALEALHPQDVLIYTSLVMIMRESIEKSRLPQSVAKSFSYRTSGAGPNYLYKTSGQYQKYRDRTEKRLHLSKTKFVTTFDIAQFFPHVYQHRLENALQSAAEVQREEDTARVLSKFIGKIASGKSYGIPTGPYASRNLAEALLVDVDAALHQNEVDFVRWMDDFTIFTKTRENAFEVISFLSRWLHEHHGLIVNQEKTQIFRKASFVAEIWKTYDDEHQHFRDLVQKMKAVDYDDADIEVAEEETSDIEEAELSEVFDLALEISYEPKYGLIKYILDSVVFRTDVSTPTREAIIKKAMESYSRLEPVFDSIAKAIAREEKISDEDVKKFCKKVCGDISSRKLFVSGHFEAWLYWLIGERKCVSLKTQAVSRLARQTDPVVKREILIALAKIGERADVLPLKTQFSAMAQIERTAAICATSKLGKDERKFWRQSANISDRYEKWAFKLSL